MLGPTLFSHYFAIFSRVFVDLCGFPEHLEFSGHLVKPRRFRMVWGRGKGVQGRGVWGKGVRGRGVQGKAPKTGLEQQN